MFICPIGCCSRWQNGVVVLASREIVVSVCKLGTALSAWMGSRGRETGGCGRWSPLKMYHHLREIVDGNLASSFSMNGIQRWKWRIIKMSALWKMYHHLKQLTDPIHCQGCSPLLPWPWINALDGWSGVVIDWVKWWLIEWSGDRSSEVVIDWVKWWLIEWSGDWLSQWSGDGDWYSEVVIYWVKWWSMEWSGQDWRSEVVIDGVMWQGRVKSLTYFSMNIAPLAIRGMSVPW